MRVTEFELSSSEYIPRQIDEGVLYVSLDHAVAVHLCACGCRTKVVTPLSRVDWQLIFDGAVTLHPSIGNGQFSCRSHYLIRSNRVVWERPQSLERAAAQMRHDQADREELYSDVATSPKESGGFWATLRRTLRFSGRS